MEQYVGLDVSLEESSVKNSQTIEAIHRLGENRRSNLQGF